MDYIKNLEAALETLEKISASLGVYNVSDTSRRKSTLGTYFGFSPRKQVRKRISRIRKDMNELISYIRAVGVLEDYKDVMPKTKEVSEIRSKVLINKEKRVIKLKKNIVRNLKTKNKLRIISDYKLDTSVGYEDTTNIYIDENREKKSVKEVLYTPIGYDKTFFNDFDKLFKDNNNSVEVKEKLEEQVEDRLHKYENYLNNSGALKKIENILFVFNGLIDRNLLTPEQIKEIDSKLDVFFADVINLDKLYRKKAKLEIYFENFDIFIDGITEPQIRQDMLKIKDSYKEYIPLINKQILILENKIELNSLYNVISDLHSGEIEYICDIENNFKQTYHHPTKVEEDRKYIEHLYETAATSLPTRIIDTIKNNDEKRTKREQTYTFYLRIGKNFYSSFDEYVKKEYLDKGKDSGFDTIEEASSYHNNMRKVERIEKGSSKRR